MLMHLSFFNHVSPPFFVSGVPTTLFLNSSRVPHFPFPILSLCSPPLPSPHLCCDLSLNLPLLFFPAPDRSYSCSSAIWACPVSFLLLKSSLLFFSRLKGETSDGNSEHRALNPGGKTFAHLPCRKASSLRVKVGSFWQIRFEIPEQVDDRGVDKLNCFEDLDHHKRFGGFLVIVPFLLDMSFRSIVRDVRESFGSLSRRSFEVRISGLPGHHRGKSVGSLSDRPVVVDQSRWVGLPPELLRDVMKRLEEGESNWPSRKNVVACAAVCGTWREICKDIVLSPEFCGKLTFPVSLKQPGPRDGIIQCFIKRDKSTSTYYLYLCLSPAVLSEDGKFLLAAKRNRRTTYTEYIISVDRKNISRSSNGYVGKMRSNFLGTKFIVYDTQTPHNAGSLVSCERGSRRISSRRVSPKVPTASYPIARVNYELNLLGTRGPRRMNCTMHSIPASALDPEGMVPGQPKQLFAPGSSSFGESFRSANTSSSSRFSITDRSLDFSSSRFSEISGLAQQDEDSGQGKERPLVLRNKEPRWHEQLQCWCLNFRGRVTVASVKNFQLIAAPQLDSESSQQAQQQTQPSNSSSASDHDKVILQFGKVAKDMFTMDYRYPLSAFQAFTICLTSFDSKLACE